MEREEPGEVYPRVPGYDLAGRREARLGVGRVLFHLLLFLMTVVTTTTMGALLSLPAIDAPDLAQLTGGLLSALLSDPAPLVSGLVFSFTLLTILGMHELGHYVACRYYDIDATLPYFIPAPPPVLIGTLGAFIRIKSPFTTRRSLFDVGVAGPIAGFIFAVPASIVGLVFAVPASPSPSEGAVVFNDPLLFLLVQKVLGLPAVMEWNPIYFGAWVGVFATGLNLVPVGQLDGGHAVYALFGNRGHRLSSVFFYITLACIGLISVLVYDSPSWLLFLILLSLLAFRRHPPTLEDEGDVGLGRKLVAAIVLLIFALSFIPFPVTFT